MGKAVFPQAAFSLTFMKKSSLICVYECLPALHTCLALQRPAENWIPRKWNSSDEPPCGCCELNPGS